MANTSVLFLLSLLNVYAEGVKSVIETQETVLATVGDEARLSCCLMEPKDVLQVTWQVILPNEEKNFGTYNKYFGQRVTSDFRDKVDIKSAGLQNSSVVFRKVTEQDEGCYRCLFNTYPEGALSATTCLKLCELHGPVLQVRESNATGESIVSCSATGRPAPAVTLSVTQPDVYFSHYDSVSVTNSNSTVSVTTTAVLSGVHSNSIRVGCEVTVLSGPQKEVLVVVPKLKLAAANAIFEESDNSGVNAILITVFIVVVTCVLLCSVIFWLCKQKHKRCDPEKIKTPLKKCIETAVMTPLMQKINENSLKRTSVSKAQKHNRQTSPLTAKRLHFDQN